MKPALLVLACLLASSTHAQDTLFDAALEAQVRLLNDPFPFGVASGDPKAESVVIWTAVYNAAHRPVEVKYIIALDTLLKNVIQQGTTTTNHTLGYSVKVKLTNLKPNTTYFYCFETDSRRSPIGRTRTLPAPNADVALLNLAFVSCSNYEWGYFNAYRHLSLQQDIAAVIHLGDYIYEYGPGKYGSKILPRKHLPAHEIISLSDYRTRYAQYRLDPDLAELHRLHPFIAVWDDHEFANDAHMSGAANHDPATEGDWNIRKAVARQAWFEWMPIDANTDQPIYRSFQFGRLADLTMLDGRMAGRQPQVKNSNDPRRFESTQTMIGQDQLNWLLNNVAQSTATWQLIGNQTIMSPLHVPKFLQNKAKTSMDMWDGYPTERDKLLQKLTELRKQVIVLTGDAHVSLDFDLRRESRRKSTHLGREWVTPSITSANLDEFMSKTTASFFQSGMRLAPGNPHLRYANVKNHGYLIVSLTPQNVTGKWVHMKSVTINGSLDTKRGYKATIRLK